MALKPGYKGKVEIESTKIGGITTWSYSGSVRELHEDTEFGDEYKTFIAGQVEGGEITITGNYLLFEDTGQQELQTAFEAGTQLTSIKLYIEDTGDENSIYLTPDDSTETASYCIITNYDNATNDRAGVGTFTCTMKVSGRLKLVKPAS